ncbi:T9SS type B sorting domain-containing protein [Psychroserpens sp. SPM9]|uniref:T9SS type B sorting domain-containing protein n=1 Tax=Psychroserpens sp. SPM9 TaxID=2975598 RepID=UPI0021A3D888|nr:T9SS type B sorting domain-containing protein [Psychroserpens sp. SPM9]MDG5492674.1 T9SS type B sorting domain-containing protein [Psychroserpens sp. SPM9]
MECLQAQKERNQWYFGLLSGMKYDGSNYSSLDDNSIERQIAFGMIEGPDNIICANDEDGNLMFYSDGRIFRNKLHQNLLNSPTDEYAVRESQAAVARDPGNPNRYYVFVTIYDGIRQKLSYSVVDMSLDDGLGGLVPDKKHILLTSRVGQHMVTARHANGRDIWLIVIREGTYLSYLITENGISNTPVTSNEGISFFDGNATQFGVMEISPDNKLIAAGFPVLKKLFILTFNDLTGKLDLIYEEEETELTIDDGAFTSVEFAPNSKVLYTTYLFDGIQQYDLSDLDNIPPRIDITTTPSHYPYLKRGPDGQVFSVETRKPYIGAIQNPNVIGDGCNYNPNVLSLSGSTLLDLPTFLLPKYPEGISFINICEGETTELTCSVSIGRPLYHWDLGDGTTASEEHVSHTYAAPGTYTVSVVVTDLYSGDLLYTETKEITIYATPNITELDDIYACFEEDTTIFFSDYNEDILNGLDPNIYSVSYYFTETDALLKDNKVIEYIPELGSKTVWARLENSLNTTCYDIAHFDIVTPEFITIDLPSDYYICDDRTTITLNAPDGFTSYEWSTGETTQSITVNTIGDYVLYVVKDFGDFTCESQTVISVKIPDPPPIIQEVNVIDWSQDHNSIEIILEEEGAYEYSVDGINYQSSPQFFNLPLADYIAYVREVNCLEEVSSDPLFLLYYNKFFTPNNDGYNDYWQIINSRQDEAIEVYIFNRYGKQLAQLKSTDKGWDGTYNGVPLPKSDYWFKVVRSNGKIHHGHFTLKR